jgi:hypothetical protein
LDEWYCITFPLIIGISLYAEIEKDIDSGWIGVKRTGFYKPVQVMNKKTFKNSSAIADIETFD